MNWLLPIFWIACSVLAYGIAFADFQAMYSLSSREQYVRENAGAAAFVALLGPVGLIVVFLLSGFAEHGLRYRLRKKAS